MLAAPRIHWCGKRRTGLAFVLPGQPLGGYSVDRSVLSGRPSGWAKYVRIVTDTGG
jgi:hypothetical protein